MARLAEFEPDRAFLLLALLGGVVLVFVNPPLQGPDEFAHLLRAYHLSEGRPLARIADQRLGDDLPESLTTRRFAPFWNAPVQPDERLRLDHFTALASVTLDPQKRRFRDFNNTSIYSPVCYAPQALALAFARWMEARPLSLLYLGRLAGLAAWAGLTAAAIRITPVGKWLFVALALTPTSWIQAAVVSADGMTNGLSFLAVAALLRAALVAAPALTRSAVLRLTTLAVALALTKFVYTPIALLGVLIPAERFGSERARWRVLAAAGSVVLVASIAWTSAVGRLVLTYDQYDPKRRDSVALVRGADFHVQLDGVLTHPLRFVRAFAESFPRDRLWLGFPGQIDWNIVLPRGFAWSWLAWLLIVARSDEATSTALSAVHRTSLLAVAGVSVALLYFLHYLTWTPVGAAQVDGVSGRYLVATSPAIFLALSSPRARQKIAVGPLLVLPGVGFAYALMLWAIVKRYYVN